MGYESLEEAETEAFLKRVKGGRPKNVVGRPRTSKVSRQAAQDLLTGDNPGGLVDLLEVVHGDLERFVASFDLSTGTKEQILARSLYALTREGHEEHLERWNRLVSSFRTSKMWIMEADALSTIQYMPKPGKASTSLDWLRYVTMWTGTIKEEQKARVKAAARAKGPDPEIEKKKREMEAVQAIAEAIKAAAANND